MSSYKKILCLSTAILLCHGSSAMADPWFPDLTVAKEASRAGDFVKAAENWAPLAEFGYTEAQLELGLLYLKGLGVSQNTSQAFSLFQKSADNGSPRGYMELGQMYEDGTGTEGQDLLKAEQLYRQAIAGGYTRASHALGRLYEKNPELSPASGRTPPSMSYQTEAYYLGAIKSGKLGYAEQIGHMYENGLGVDKNLQKALTMYLIAARAGSSSAQEKAASLQSTLTLDAYQTAMRQADDMIAYIRVPGFYDPDLKSGRATRAKREHERAALYKKLDQITPQTHQPADHSHYIRAAEQYQKAIKSGYFASARNLGMMYEKGYGFSKNPLMALTYYYLGAMSGAKSADLSAQKLSAKMALTDIEQAKKDAEILYKKYSVAPAIIPPRKPYRFVADAKTQFLAEDNLDLSTRNTESETSFLADARIGLYLYPSDNVTAYLEGRAISNSGLASSDNDDSNDSADSTYGEIRQAWVEFDRILGNPLLSFKAGRQRFYEERAVMWNRDLDALKLTLDSTLTSGFLAAGHNFDNYRIGDNDDFLGSEQKRLRLLGEISRKISMDHTLEARFLYENDYSDAENIGRIVSPEDRDNEDSQLLWGNVRLKGKFNTPETFFSGLEYRLDGLMVTGEETTINSSAIANTSNRLVTGQVDRDVMGWGMDAGLVLNVDAPLSPSLTIGYAFGSGDDDSTGRGDNHAFRQTDLEGNSGRRPDERSSFTSRHYGEVLRPELSNIHVIQAGVSIPVQESSQINLTYFNYHLDAENAGIRSAGISAPLNGTDSYLGQAVDLEFNVDMDETFDLTQPLLTQSSSRVRLGAFQAGEAFGVAEDEYAFRGTLEFRIKF